MKKIKYLCLMLALVMVVTSFGCYAISGQKMSTVKGTYKLTHYTRIREHERKPGYTAKTINYLEDEDKLYENYLVVTGTNQGYFVHKAVNVEPYVKEVSLSYEYNQEDSSKVEYVIFNDVLGVNSESGQNKLGVTKNHFNYSKAAFDYTQLFTRKKMRSEALSVRWEKVDKATDLSYVEKQISNLKKYDFESFGARGIYELNRMTNIETGEYIESDYQYFFYVIDTATNALSATVYYALKETPTTQVVNTVPIVKTSETWDTMTIDGAEWTIDPQWYTYFYNETDGVKRELVCISSDISTDWVQQLIEQKLPTIVE